MQKKDQFITSKVDFDIDEYGSLMLLCSKCKEPWLGLLTRHYFTDLNPTPSQFREIMKERIRKSDECCV